MLDPKSIFSQVIGLFSPPSAPAPTGRSHLLVRDGYTLKQTDDRGPTRAHVFSDLGSLLHYLQRHGTPGDSTLFCDAEAFTAIICDKDGNDRDWLRYTPTWTEAAKFWRALASGGPRPHVKFKQAIEDHAADLADKGLLAAVAKFQHRAEVNYEAALEDAEQVTFMIKNQAGAQGVAKMPKTFEVDIPLFIGWDVRYRLGFRLLYDAMTQQVTFSIEARDWPEVIDKALADLVRHSWETLGEDWLVVRGVPKLATSAAVRP